MQEDLYAIHRRSHEEVKDLNTRVRRQLSRCPQVERDENRFRTFYYDLFKLYRYTHEKLHLARLRTCKTFKRLAEETVLLERTAPKWGRRPHRSETPQKSRKKKKSVKKSTRDKKKASSSSEEEHAAHVYDSCQDEPLAPAFSPPPPVVLPPPSVDPSLMQVPQAMSTKLDACLESNSKLEARLAAVTRSLAQLQPPPRPSHRARVVLTRAGPHPGSLVHAGTAALLGTSPISAPSPPSLRPSLLPWRPSSSPRRKPWIRLKATPGSSSRSWWPRMQSRWC